LPRPQTEIPPHIPPELLVDFDFYRPAGAQADPVLMLKPRHEPADIFWAAQ